MSEWLEASLKTALRDYKQQLQRTEFSVSSRNTMVRDAVRFAVFLLNDKLDEGTVKEWKASLDRRSDALLG